MNKVKKKLIGSALLAVFVLLFVLLGILNTVNFSMAAEDADRLTGMIAEGKGRFEKEMHFPEGTAAMQPGTAGTPGFRGPMGPDSPEMQESLRYFTYRFDKDGNGVPVEFRISALTEEEAAKLAESVKDRTVGWVNTVYRFRVYTIKGETYVTVIDQGRELTSCYRILWISVAGLVIGLMVSLVFLILISNALFRPLEEADRRQKKFIAEAEGELKVPITVIHANVEKIEEEHGPSEASESILRQVKKLSGLAGQLGAMTVLDEGSLLKTQVPLSELLTIEIDSNRSRYGEKGIRLKAEITPDIVREGDADAFARAFSEIVGNGYRFAAEEAEFILAKEEGQIVFTAKNKTPLPDGQYDRVFDRFTTLDQAGEGSGLGLSYVKDVVKAHNGRLSAKVENGYFILTVRL